MAYHETFWATAATVTSAILVATAVALGQSIDTMVERVRERRRRHVPGSARLRDRARRRSLARAYVYGIASIVLTVIALLLAMLCLLDDADLVPPWSGLLCLFGGVVLIFAQIAASADAKLSEVRALPSDDGSDADADAGAGADLA